MTSKTHLKKPAVCMSRAGRSGFSSTFRVFSGNAENARESLMHFEEFRLRRRQLRSQRNRARIYAFQELFCLVGASSQLLDPLRDDVFVIPVPTKKFSISRVLRACARRVESDRSARTGRTHPASATVRAVECPAMIAVRVFAILFVVMTVRRRVSFSKVLRSSFLRIFYT